MTETTESLHPNNQTTIQCLLRKHPVKASPEEKVRQFILRKLIDTLGYPASLIVIEKKLSELPRKNTALICPARRLDLLVYSPVGEPLLLIECKAAKITPAAIRQLLGYNIFIGAKAVALVGPTEEVCVIEGRKGSKIPSWNDLIVR